MNLYCYDTLGGRTYRDVKIIDILNAVFVTVQPINIPQE